MRIGMEMNHHLAGDKGCLQRIRQDFLDQNDRLSYFNLFQYIEHDMKIKMNSWEKDSLEGRLDRLGFAFIEFNEFNEFCMEFGINFGEELVETDLEDMLDQKINTSYMDYKISKDDYLNEIPSILKSEKAALARVHQIWTTQKFKESQGQKVGKYIDPDFGPRRKTDVKGSAMAMYKTGEVPRKGYAEPAKVEWVFAE